MLTPPPPPEMKAAAFLLMSALTQARLIAGKRGIRERKREEETKKFLERREKSHCGRNVAKAV